MKKLAVSVSGFDAKRIQCTAQGAFSQVNVRGLDQTYLAEIVSKAVSNCLDVDFNVDVVEVGLDHSALSASIKRLLER